MDIQVVRLSAFAPPADGSADASAALRACLEEAGRYPRSLVVLEPGDYLVDNCEPLPLRSGMTVRAEGAVFRFPRSLNAAHSRVMFSGDNVQDLQWYGGHFVGYVYDPQAAENDWEPADYTGCLQVSCTGEGVCARLLFSGITAENVAGAVVHVRGRRDAPATDVDVRDCRFTNCGKFMWDYGYLWQHAVFSEAYTPAAVDNAFRYLPRECISSPLRAEQGRLYAEHMPAALPEERDAVTFFGPELPRGIARGRQYFVLNRGADNGLLLSETEGGAPLPVESVPPGTRLFRNMFYIFHDLYAPLGDHAHQKGSIDTTRCRNVTVTGCRISASGDSMHILECENVVFSANQITGARMGAFYIGFHCRNVTVTGNTVYGTNGSRTCSVERSTRDITLVGNTFIGGGRGSWFNQPYNLILSDNLFLHNTEKCVPDLRKGRMCHVTGDFERYPEVYFTTWEPNASYGPVLMRGNIIETGEQASAAVAFNPGGRDIVLESNVFRGTVREVHVAAGCETPHMHGNVGMGAVTEHTFVNTANVR